MIRLLTPTGRAWLFCLIVIFAVIGWGSLIYWMIAPWGGEKPGLFALANGCLLGACVGSSLLMLERSRSLDELERRRRDVEDNQRAREKYALDNGLQPRTWEVTVTDGPHMLRTDLIHAHGGYAVTAEVNVTKFMHHIQRGGHITSRDCEPLFGGNRGAYTRVRNELVRVGVLRRTGAGTFEVVNPLPSRA